jgi:type IV pilus assembly protein PilX
MSGMNLAKQQSGVSLVIVLVFLVMLSLLGVTAMRTAGIEEKMSGNERDRQLAFEAAEAALRDAERDVQQNLNAGAPFASACTDGLCLPAVGGAMVSETVDWMGALPRSYGSRTGAGVLPFPVARQPRYLIELLPNMMAPSGDSASAMSSATAGTPFRITATGWGRRLSSQVQLQVVYVRRS